MNKNILDAIVANGDEYCRRLYENYPDPRTLEKDWWQAFDFFLGRACFQGRRDKLSEKVYDKTREVLSPLFNGKEGDINYE